MHKKLLLAVCVFMAFFLNACKKSNVQPNPSSSVSTDKKSDIPPVTVSSGSVYIVGNIVAQNGQSVAVYWKDGVMTRLSDSSYSAAAQAIIISGTDIYIAGFANATNGQAQAVYWKNGVKAVLSSTNDFEGYAMAITVNGNDVYVVGYSTVNGQNFLPTYWKNGVEATFTNQLGPVSAYASGIAVNNNSVYVCGQSDPNAVATIWKDGAGSALYNTGEAAATAIAASGNDVYICGFGGSSIYPTYWKNGTASVLDTTGFGMAKAITLASNNVYIAGYISNRNFLLQSQSNVVNTPCYWKNGTITKLQGLSGCVTTGIAVSGSDVYLTGTNSLYTDQLNIRAVYWKNGQLITLNQGVSGAYGIAVAP